MDRAELLAALEQMRSGQRKVAELVKGNLAKQPSEAERSEISTMRDTVANSLNTSGLIKHASLREVRVSMDVPGGVEHLLGELLSVVQARQPSKQASAQGQLGRSSERSLDESRGTKFAAGSVVGQHVAKRYQC